MRTALTIAGSDPSGGAGIQADIKTITVLGVYAMSAITSLTSQNTMGIADIIDVPADFLASQLDSIFSDIYPDAVKIGMLSSVDLINVVVSKLKKYNSVNIVLDPVIMSTSGTMFTDNNALLAMKCELFPLAGIITPNIPEAEFLTGFHICSHSDMESAAELLGKNFNCAVLVKGGHFHTGADDVLYTKDGRIKWYCSERLENSNTHGTGCTLSSAIAANLAKGEDIVTSVTLAKEYLNGAIAYGLDLGSGNGPLAHNYKIIRKG